MLDPKVARDGRLRFGALTLTVALDDGETLVGELVEQLVTLRLRGGIGGVRDNDHLKVLIRLFNHAGCRFVQVMCVVAATDDDRHTWGHRTGC